MSATDQELLTSGGKPIPQAYDFDAGRWKEVPGNETDGYFVQSNDGANASIGAKADAAATGTGTFSVIALLKGLFASLAGTVSLTDRSVTGTGSAQGAAAANTSRKYLLLQAPDTNGDSVWVCLVGTAAAADESSMQVPPGGGFEWSAPGRVPSGAVSVLAQGGDSLMLWEG